MNEYYPSKHDTKTPTDTSEQSKSVNDVPSETTRQAMSASEYKRQIDMALEAKEYHHWNSPAEQEANRRRVENYDAKKRAADVSSLQTQSSVLGESGEHFDQANLARIQSDFGSNKIEIYNERTFEREKVSAENRNRVLGLRELEDGKICVKDTDDIDDIRHVSTHETLHDLSFQNQESDSHVFIDVTDRLVEDRKTVRTSGIHQIYDHKITSDGSVIENHHADLNRALNEGITEYKSIIEMQKRGEFPRFDSYTEQVGWAQKLEGKVGKDVLDAAYYGGNLDALEQRVNDMSPEADAWRKLNAAIDGYSRTDISAEVRKGYCQRAEQLINDLQEDRLKERGAYRL